ncbi:hypothetical protein BU251_01575 [Candidatus Velamenicoccus archaeovorus]|uniref:SnoaL-like domain-containing protein n=1 Tax=Velamenicoccus archaeovorus TaxID=1930593 RepID=A0A410P349_VELA1|nr:hypothetical protein [Candidatus Velamenicoccus archaeovorus]QAT16508.1 hypothetical protein BU251_01575 [Candidatus Velamenicoccus archaeovorus]
MLKHPGRFIFGVAFLAVIGYALVSFLQENDEAKIRRTVYAAVLGVERNEPARYGRVLSASYKDEYGNDKASVLKIAADAFKDYKPFKVEIKALKTEVQGPEATTQIAYRCLFKKSGGSGQIYYDAGKLIASWRKETSGWKIVKIEYTGSQEMLFLPVVA